MPFRTKAWKCNHWATGELLEVGSKFYGTFMHMHEMKFLLTAQTCFGIRVFKFLKDLA